MESVARWEDGEVNTYCMKVLGFSALCGSLISFLNKLTEAWLTAVCCGGKEFAAVTDAAPPVVELRTER